MDKHLAGILHAHHSGDIAAGSDMSLPSEMWPAEWLEVQYKDYPRLGPAIALDATDLPALSLGPLLARRRSAERFDSDPIPVEILAAALNGAVRESSGPTTVGRPYPSAGALYPVDAYLLSMKVAPLEQGVYHYRADRHDLTLLFARDDLEEAVGRIHGQDLGSPAAMFAFTASVQRNSGKYGSRGYRFALLEMGACAFGLDLALHACGLRTRWIGGFADAAVASLLGISIDQELELPTLLLAAG